MAAKETVNKSIDYQKRTKVSFLSNRRSIKNKTRILKTIEKMFFSTRKGVGYLKILRNTANRYKKPTLLAISKLTLSAQFLRMLVFFVSPLDE